MHSILAQLLLLLRLDHKESRLVLKKRKLSHTITKYFYFSFDSTLHFTKQGVLWYDIFFGHSFLSLSDGLSSDYAIQ